MCAIFGAPTFSQYKTLYKHNFSRGHAAFGGLFQFKKAFFMFKAPGEVDFDKFAMPPITAHDELELFSGQYVSDICDKIDFFVGHTQAPTSAAQTFSPETSHPFFYGNWIVAHNGVLSNYTELTKNVPFGSYNIVDSSVIPALLQHHECQFENDTQTILHVLKLLQGTYSLWIFNAATRSLHIARCGSTLFANQLDNTFSSISQPGMRELPDGSLFLHTPEGLTQVGSFESNSPFLIL